MKKRFFILFVFFPSILFAQNESDTLGNGLNSTKNQHLEINPVPNSQSQSLGLTPLNMYQLYQDQLTGFQKTIRVPELKMNTNFQTNINPTDNLYHQYFINSRSWINTLRTSTGYIGIGGIIKAGASYNLKIGNFGIITGGIYAAKFNIYNNFYNNAGVNGNFKLLLSDRFSMNIFGQYTPQTSNSMIQLLSPMYPQSYYGGSFEFKVTDKWGIITGAQREFDVFSRKWIMHPFILPIFYSK